ncbi:Arm domain-containing protein/Patatin domain-containing protein/LRR_8 domain-containing protein [Cephalotus follicularis]|uniref:Patatin n=1 Tax=Cephalotus follicularis TaxID=3775 RepID=A0A1Q3CP78_CEPFO|nr:Arm domain-containing protein/Patatin domain-containing protein/LRR_8 domain-containing protein [Cephalotus follicularis]
MSWGLGWKRSSEIFRLTLNYGAEESGNDLSRSSSASSRSSSSSSLSSSASTTSASPSPPTQPQDQEIGFRIELDWTTGDDEDQVALRLQSQLMVALPVPQDAVVVELTRENASAESSGVGVEMKVVKRREPLKAITMTKTVGSGQLCDGIGVLTRLLRSNLVPSMPGGVSDAGGCGDHWKSVTMLNLCSCGLSVLPVELTRLPLLEKLYMDNNRLSLLPPEVGELKNLKVLSVDNNILVSVPVELKQCVQLVELSLEHNKLVRPLLDFRAMAELQILRLFGNPLEFLPDILPLHQLRHLSLANIRVVSDENLRSVNVLIEMENSSYFGASRHKLSAFFSLIFRFSSCHHPLLASALAKIMQDQGNRVVVAKDENAVRQLISMISSDNRHVVEQACSALSSLAGDVSLAMQLMKCDIMQPIETVMKKSVAPEELVSVLQVVVNLGFACDTVSQKMLTRDVLKSLKLLCAHRNPEVQRLALLAVGNLAFCLENRRILVTSESLRDLLLRLTVTPEPRVNKAAARALAILGENEILRRAIRGRQVARQGLRILAMDGGGMKGLATVQILKEIEKTTGKRIHELFDLICGTSTGGMLAVALGIKLMTLDQCEEIYKNLGKLVFAEPVLRDNEAATWREKLDQLYKSSSQSFRVVVHGSKHSADQFERLLKEMCADGDGDLLIDSAVKNIPKVFVVSTLVSVMPAQPFVFRNYQYPAGTPEVSFSISETSGITVLGSPTTGAQVGYKRSAFIGSCKHQIWQAIRASSAAPYYLDDYSDDVYRWQDGAIVANNPTIFAIREAQLLWPDTRIDCLVSIGCGSVPTKVRKGGWRYLDTGQVLIESACSVDRVEEALSTLLPMLPEIQYYRFNPVDECCDMELDETDPAVWQKLEAAVNEYIQNNFQAFKNICERLLLPFQLDEKGSENIKSQFFKAKASSADESGPSLGWRRGVLLVEALHCPDSRRFVHHARALESYCSRNAIQLSLLHGISGISKTVASTTFTTPFTSPLITGSFPSSPLIYSPDVGPHRVGRIDMVPPLSLDGLQPGMLSASPPKSPGSRQLSLPIRSLHEKLQNLPQVGIIHLALQNDTVGSILSWQNDVFVVAEPGELADKFLQNVKLSLLSVMRSRCRKAAAFLANISTIADLVKCKPYFQVGNIVHRYIGRQTQVMEDDQEIGAYMFRRTVPSMHITPDDVRWMVGAWRDRIIICSGTYGPTPALIKALLDSGAKAVICPLAEPHETSLTTFHGVGEFNIWDNGRFEIGEEEEEVTEPASPGSDWEDSDPDKSGAPLGFWDDYEEELSKFVCQLYDSLFREGARVDVALQNALASHRKLRYFCHLPSKQ